MLLSASIVAFACGPRDDSKEPDQVVPAGCQGLWPEDRCSPRCDTEEKERWRKGLLLAAERAWGVDGATVREHVDVLSVFETEYFTSPAIVFQLDFDGTLARSRLIPADPEFAPQSVEEAASRLEFPPFPLDAAPATRAEREGSLKRCEGILGLSFPTDGWCEPLLGYEDPVSGQLSGGHRFTSGDGGACYSLAVVDLWTAALFRCEATVCVD